MTELGFLIDLILNEKLTRRLKDRISERIKMIEANGQSSTWNTVLPRQASANVSIHDGQPESTKRLLEKLQDMPGHIDPIMPPQPVTQAAAEALNRRQQIINDAVNGRQDKTRTSPKKF